MTVRRPIRDLDGRILADKRWNNVDLMYWRWINVESTLFQRCMPAGMKSLFLDKHQLNLNVRKRPFWLVQSACESTQSDHRSQSLLSLWRTVAYLAIQNAPSEDSDQTARMRRLIRIFAGCACPKGNSGRCGAIDSWICLKHEEGNEIYLYNNVTRFKRTVAY